MAANRRKEVLLTFDIEGVPPNEDSLDGSSLMCLHRVLDMMDEHRFRGIFFIAGVMAEQIGAYPETVERLSQHRIGYHGTSHERSLPIIQRSDVPDYKQAVESLTSSENYAESTMSPTHNLQTLKEVFPKNDITCFRAPFLAWTPPYLEALTTYGIKFDFSSYVSDTPVTFKGITFYPGPITIDETLATFMAKADPRSVPRLLCGLLLRNSVSVLHFHPSSLLFHRYYYPRKRRQLRGETQVKLAISILQFLFKRISILRESNLVDVTSHLSESWRPLKPENLDIGNVYRLGIMNAANHFNYHPRFILSHFMQFFDQEKTSSRLNAEA